MQYIFSPKLKTASFAMIVIGVVLYGIGFFLHQQDVANSTEYINSLIDSHPKEFFGDYITNSYAELNTNHEEHMHHLENLLKNRPWAAFYVPAYLSFGIAASALFFLCIQFVANAGWSMVVSRVMEGIATFLPVGAILVGIVALSSAFGLNHLYHWMDSELIDVKSPKYDVYIANKADLWLNIPFWTIRVLIYLVILPFMVSVIKNATRKLDDTNGDLKVYAKLYKKAVIYLVIFAICSAAFAWDFIMSLDPHWFSSLFMWYGMVSYLVSSVSIMAILSIYLKRNNSLPLFNDNHLHDLTKYMFGFSLLWSYLWFCQFMLQWYANIPEEAQYFQQRISQYPLYFWMLIVNLLAPFLILISSSMKRRFQLVFIMGFVIIVGHYWDFYNQIIPATVGPFHNFGLMELGSLVGIAGLFIFVVMNALSKLNLEAKGHPYFHESKIYEYPF